MRIRLVLIAAAASVAAMFTVTNLPAQRPRPPVGAQAGPVLLDVTKLVNEHARLHQALEKLKKEYESAAESLKAESERGNQLTERLRKLPRNSPEAKKLERQITKMRADFDLSGKRATEQIKDRESKLYHAFSRELQAEIARFAQATGTKLVLRYDPPAQELHDPRKIMQEMSRLVVYQQGLDATAAVHQGMHQRTSAAGPAAQPRSRQPARR